jgi:hypothetical protein
MSDLTLSPDVAELIARSRELARRSLELEKEIVEVSEEVRKRQEELERGPDRKPKAKMNFPASHERPPKRSC